MISARHIAALAFGLNTLSAFAATDFDTSSLNGQMVPPYVKAAMSAEGVTAMEAAKNKILNQDGDQESTWIDPKADFSGTFKISARRMRADSQAPCREYLHSLTKRSGGPVISQKTGGALTLRDTVCVQNNRWERFQGDASLLLNENGTVIAVPEKIAPAGQDHRIKNEKLIGPSTFGVILESYTRFKGESDNQKRTLTGDQLEVSAQDLITQRDEYLNKLVAGMVGADKYMDLDQLGLLLPQIDSDKEKLKVVTTLRARLDVSIGNADVVIDLFREKAARNSVRKMLRK